MIILQLIKLLIHVQFLWWNFSEGAVWSCSGENHINNLTEFVRTEIGKEISTSFCIETDKDTIAHKFSVQRYGIVSDVNKKSNLVTLQINKTRAIIKLTISNISYNDFQSDVIVTLVVRENKTRNEQDFFSYKLTLINTGSAQIAEITDRADSTAVAENNEVSRMSYTHSDLQETDVMETSNFSTAKSFEKQTLFSTLTTYISTEFQSQKTQSIIERNNEILDINSQNEPTVPPSDKIKITVGITSTSDKVPKNAQVIDSKTEEFTTEFMKESKLAISDSSNKILSTDRDESSTALLSEETLTTTWSPTSFTMKETYRPVTSSSMPQISVNRTRVWPYAVTMTTTISSAEECHQIDSKVSHTCLSNLKYINESVCLLIRSNSSTSKSSNECAPYGGRIVKYILISKNYACLKDMFEKENISCVRYYDPSINYIGLLNITSVKPLSFCNIYGVLCISKTDKTGPPRPCPGHEPNITLYVRERVEFSLCVLAFPGLYEYMDFMNNSVRKNNVDSVFYWSYIEINPTYHSPWREFNITLGTHIATENVGLQRLNVYSFAATKQYMLTYNIFFKLAGNMLTAKPVKESDRILVNTDVLLECRSPKPTTSIEIIRLRDQHRLNVSQGQQSLTYFFHPIKCEDMGSYQCVVDGNQSDTIEVPVFVCSPQPCPGHDNLKLLLVRVNETLQLSFCITNVGELSEDALLNNTVFKNGDLHNNWRWDYAAFPKENFWNKSINQWNVTVTKYLFEQRNYGLLNMTIFDWQRHTHLHLYAFLQPPETEFYTPSNSNSLLLYVLGPITAISVLFAIISTVCLVREKALKRRKDPKTTGYIIPDNHYESIQDVATTTNVPNTRGVEQAVSGTGYLNIPIEQDTQPTYSNSETSRNIITFTSSKTNTPYDEIDLTHEIHDTVLKSVRYKKRNDT